MYGSSQSSVSSVVQPISQTTKEDCPAHRRVYCRGTKEELYDRVLSSFHEQHNHEVSEHIYKQDSYKIVAIHELSSFKDAIA